MNMYVGLDIKIFYPDGSPCPVFKPNIRIYDVRFYFVIFRLSTGQGDPSG